MELLELTLSPVNDQRFLANASRVPDGVGDATTECDLPFWVGKQDWRRTIIKILESSQGFRSENFPEMEEQDWLEQEGLLLPSRQHFDSAYLRRIGQALYQSLFPPDSPLKQVLQHSLRLTEQHNTDLHLRLKFAADSGKRSRLADYPWELLHDGQRFLLHHRVRLSRYIAHEASPPKLSAQEQIRVLLISARPQGLAQLTQAEQQAIQVGLERAQDAGLVQLQILPTPARRTLNRYLTDCTSEQLPQVLHFDGHGVFGRRCGNPGCLTMHSGIKVESCRVCGQRLPEPQGYLAFETEEGKPDWQSATQVAALLQPYPIALVVLSACQSGMAVAGDSVFNGMAQNLIDQRIPAVVAMQYSVRADAACDFAEQFYRVLGKKEALLKALNQGIREMDVEGNQWYRPVIYLRWQDNEGGNLFESRLPQESLSNPNTQPQPDTEPLSPEPPKLSRLQQLELVRFQDDLARCERDYKTVADQLKLEGDGVRQNQLKDQLKVLGQQIEQIEQEIQIRERDIQQSSARLRLEELKRILDIHLNLFPEVLRACQQLFAIRKYSPGQTLQNAQELIAELLRIPPGRSQPYDAIEQFVACLVSSSQNTALLTALQGWVEQYVQEGWQELLERVEDYQKQTAQEAQPVVLVAISRSDEASTQEQEGNRYQVKAWRIQDRDQYKQHRQGYSPIEIPGSTGEETYTLDELITTTPALLIRFLSEGSNEFTNDPEIHIFLPLELMNQDVDCWLLNDGYGMPKLLGHEYKVVLRCAERLSRSYRQRPRWIKKWQQHESFLEKTAFEFFTAGDDSDLDELSYTLDEIEETIVGLKVMRAPCQVEPDGLFGVLLQSGLPLAVWGRCDLREPTNEAELDRILQACCLEQLPSTVKQERRQSRKVKDKDCHIGHHLSLLWDDPHLVPPKFA
ncbi:hypothetical protein C7B76_02335 [filamentous cyanobacterium CCP2]|nr:hypothetical protein C7B76_02335 [filamentous cyanobacterium CCP2]